MKSGVAQTETLVRVELTEAGEGQTRMQFHQEGFKSEESRDGHRGGWEECFDLLEEALAGARREIFSTRRIDYPRALVYRAYTEPEHLARWWGPNGFTNTFEVFEPQPGGLWRFTMHGPDGRDYPNETVFREIVPRERIVFDHTCEPHFQARIEFADEVGGTRVTYRMIFESASKRDRIAVYAVDCNEQNFNRLEAELARMTASI